MAEKRAWLTDPETGEKFHAWSHVKSIFYNKATNILLKDKLDEMDKLIDEKIKKAMMSNIQLNDQNKVPTSALAYNMQQLINKNADDITKLNSDLRTKAEVLLQSFPFSIVIPAQGYAFVDITITIPDGYYLGTFTVFGGESRNAVSLGAVLISDTVISVEGHNGFTSELTVPGNVNVLFFRQP